MLPIQLQQLNLTDAFALHDISLRSYSDHYLHLWYDKAAWYTEKCFSISNLAAELADKNALFWIIYLNEKPVGFLKVNVDAPLDGFSAQEAMELERIYLLKEVTTKGIGSYLVDFVVQLARQHNKKLLWLKVMDSSEGPIRFYKKHGFNICGAHHLDFGQMKEEFRGMYIMQKQL